MRYYVFESGSKGNCTLIEANHHYLVIDCGIKSLKQAKQYFDETGVMLDQIKTVLVTHSHTDHIASLKIFPKDVIYASNVTLDVDEQHELIPYHEYDFDGFHVLVVPTSHDAKGSIGFVINYDDEKMVYITDTGYIYERVLPFLKGADYYIFEANHDVRMQLNTGRPQCLIDRIMGPKGHLSNEDSALYLSELITSKTKEITLAHLSEEADTPELALSAFNKIMHKRNIDISNINVRCASQHQKLEGGNIAKEIING